MNSQALIEFAKKKNGEKITTAGGRRYFSVEVGTSRLEFIIRSGRRRYESFSWVKKFCESFDRKKSKHPKDYPATRNASYLIGLTLEFQKAKRLNRLSPPRQHAHSSEAEWGSTSKQSSANVTILWHEEDCEGYVDILPIEWFTNCGHQHGYLHRVTGPRAGRYEAKCDLLVEPTYADLDYGAHPRFNNKQGMDLGVMRICFDGETRARITQVLWKSSKDPFRPIGVTVAIEQNSTKLDSEFIDPKKLTGVEGHARLVSHLKRERNPELIIAKKAAVFAATNKLACEACGFVFTDKYGDLGEGFCEVHHRIALSAGHGVRITTLDDLAVVCANCHRMIHRTGNPMLSLEEFAKTLQSRAKATFRVSLVHRDGMSGASDCDVK